MEDIQQLMVQVMDDHGDYLKKTAYMLVYDIQLAEDLVQETFFAFYKSRHNFRREASYKTYLYRILMNQIKMYVRKKKPIFVEDPTVYRQTVSFEDHVIYAMDLHRCLTQIDIKYRQVIVLYYFDGFTVQEIAGVLGLSKSATKMRLKRGKEQLSILLEGGTSNEKVARDSGGY